MALRKERHHVAEIAKRSLTDTPGNKVVKKEHSVCCHHFFHLGCLRVAQNLQRHCVGTEHREVYNLCGL